MTNATKMVLLVTTSLLLACGDDDRGDDRLDDMGAADMGPAEMDLGPGEPDLGGGDPVGPTITRVEWTQVADCAGGTRSDVTIDITVDDPDTDAASLSFSGSVSGCTGELDGATAVVSCPQGAPYTGSVTVTDPEGGSDTAGFTVGVCSNGSVEP